MAPPSPGRPARVSLYASIRDSLKQWPADASVGVSSGLTRLEIGPPIGCRAWLTPSGLVAGFFMWPSCC
jgi:hypothetical protein